jgi:hypothetical protein
MIVYFYQIPLFNYIPQGPLNPNVFMAPKPTEVPHSDDDNGKVVQEEIKKLLAEVCIH